ncbi:hypothetical protein LX32DRAFT_66490 [Colletotrichum zoysiae]|uniref:Uncharacterized protein n=1 Tax=Colletotrichum zoysiae TaxID=1216348 RepID=A0AAD9HAI0_9PEZI|nr:hypothetical protein LX32DRAFT_66490 [Colletotrichum zoysiae]
MRHARCKRKLSDPYGYMIGLPLYYLPPSSMLGPDRVPPKTAIGHMLIYFIHNHHVPPWLCCRSRQDKLRVTTSILAWVPMPRPRTQPNQVKQAMPALPSSKCHTPRYVGVYLQLHTLLGIPITSSPISLHTHNAPRLRPISKGAGSNKAGWDLTHLVGLC